MKSNYQQVANLPFVSKIIENAAILRLTEHCSRNGIEVKYQSVYKKFHSCETSLVNLVNSLLWNMERGEISTLVCLDLSAAFDTVDHEILLNVL